MAYYRGRSPNVVTPESVAAERAAQRAYQIALQREERAASKSLADAEQMDYDRSRDTMSDNRALGFKEVDLLKERDAAMRQAEKDRLEREWTERVHAEGRPLRDMELQSRSLAVEEARMKRDAAKADAEWRMAPPSAKIDAVAPFWQTYEFEDKTSPQAQEHLKNPDALNRIVFDYAVRGRPVANIAATYGLVPKTQSVNAGPFGLFSRQAPIEVSPDFTLPKPAGIGLTGASMNGVERGLANLNPEPAPVVDPQTQADMALVEDFRRRAAENPAWVRTLTNRDADRIEAAFDRLNAPKQPAPLSQAPGVAPGRIVPDGTLSGMTPDMNGDGRKTRDEIDAGYQQSLSVVQKAEAKRKANPAAFAKLSPAALQAIKQAELHVKAYEGVFKKQATASIEQGLNGVRQ